MQVLHGSSGVGVFGSSFFMYSQLNMTKSLMPAFRVCGGRCDGHCGVGHFGVWSVVV